MDDNAFETWVLSVYKQKRLVRVSVRGKIPIQDFNQQPIPWQTSRYDLYESDIRQIRDLVNNDNIVPACQSCNSRKGHRSLLIFIYDTKGKF